MQASTYLHYRAGQSFCQDSGDRRDTSCWFLMKLAPAWFLGCLPNSLDFNLLVTMEYIKTAFLILMDLCVLSEGLVAAFFRMGENEW
jgi:hypothetical protein